MKKLFAVLLAVAMLLSLGVTAFAANTGKITVVNAPEGVSYRAYKLFDAEKTDDNKVKYTIADDSVWLKYLIYTVKNATDDDYTDRWEAVHGEDYKEAIDETSATLPMTVDDKVGFEFIYDATNHKYIVKAKTDYDAAKFAAYLRELVDQTAAPNMSTDDLDALTYTASSDVAFNPDAREMTALADGYYLVLAGTNTPSYSFNGKTTLTKGEFDDLTDSDVRALYTPVNAEDLTQGYQFNGNLTLNKDGYGRLTSAAVKALYTVSYAPDSFDPLSNTGMLTTVLDGQNVQIQNKNDMPLDKKVGTGETTPGTFDGKYDDNTTGVQIGQTLYYEVITQIPELTASQTSYVFQLKDDMTAGLTPGEKITIKVMPADWTPDTTGTTTPALTIVLERDTDSALKTGNYSNWFETKDYDPSYELANGNYVRFNKNGYAWELSLDVAGKYDLNSNPPVNPHSFRQYAGQYVLIEYSATVNAEAVSEVLTNHVLLTYGENGEFNKDGETKNYLSKIVVDKYETGSPTSKLQGAEFALYKAEVHNWMTGQTNANNGTNATTGADGYVPADSTAVPQKGADGEDMYDIYYYALYEITYKKGTDTITNTQYKALTDKTGWDKQETLIKWAQWDEVDGELKLAKLDDKGEKHLKADGTNATSEAEYYYYGKEDIEVKWVLVDAETFDPADETTAASTFTRVRTNRDGAAQFGYLPDSAKDIKAAETGCVNKAESDLNAYYLVETKAPVDYVRLVNPVRVDVNGKAATAPNMSETQQQTILSNVAAIANTPGSTLPSTGGVGATMMTIGGVALILAAGVFLVLRRRKEQE